MMHEHDQELIMALAEGNLDDAAAEGAREEIAGCPECSADLELQLLAITALDDLPEVYLTATESSLLHNALKQELSLATPQPTRTKRSFAWGRFLPVAGVAAVLLVVIVSLPSLLGGGSDDSSDEAIAAPAMDAEAPESAATETTAAASMEMLDSAADAADGDDRHGGAAATEAPADLGAAEPTTTTAADIQEDNLYIVFDMLEFLGPLEDVDTAELLERIRSEDLALLEYSEDAKSADEFFSLCLEETVTEEVASIWTLPPNSNPIILGSVVDSVGEELVLIAYVPEEIDETVVAAVAYGCMDIRVLP